MSTPVQVQTLGPSDPNAGLRAKVYSALTVVTPLLSALATFGILDSKQANALTALATSAVGVLSAFGFGLAAKNTNKQVNNGTFDPAPPPPPLPPALTAVDAVKAVGDQFTDFAKTVAAGVQHVQDTAVGLVPGLAAILSTSNAVEPGSLVDQFLKGGTKSPDTP